MKNLTKNSLKNLMSQKAYIIPAFLLASILTITGCTGTRDNAQSAANPPAGTANSSTSSSGQSNAAKPTYQRIAPAEAKKQLSADKSIILLDVRTKEEYAQLHIPGSMLIPLDTLEKQASSKIPDKNAKIFIYCRSGNRSKEASNLLLKLGYTNVHDLGGIIDWKYETEAGA